MRVEFANAIINNYNNFSNQVFFTGDLGFMALEKVQETFGDNFINAGVAEQNMVSMAASLSQKGFLPWVYSISPFITLRPYEQLRNDVCLHNCPVKVVANGGGFGYGIMGSTHHNIEDIGSMRLLQNMKVFIPCTASDVEEAVVTMLKDDSPNYLRLNLAAKLPNDIKPFSAWRKIADGNDGVVIATGPIVENILAVAYELGLQFEVWVVSIFPFGELPKELIDKINTTKKLITIEEHAAAGGLGESVGANLLGMLNFNIKYLSLHAKGYLSGKYGNQKWHQEENGLAGNALKINLENFIK